ncbi:trimethylamine methyltransferase family protein [Ruegeria marina]|uniref:Trimethylamine:corrinoid methyltransferase n=1 Tax=Ruegeria marina TaxID=639004 RepID=A0A1G6JKE4_9RHOB|nr:trimethylamine methyltransferase family protein [Ruegeria marina]SDC19131.1 Trimethylamine:corrinoid methyltransferase [Ruegeria marina]
METNTATTPRRTRRRSAPVVEPSAPSAFHPSPVSLAASRFGFLTEGQIADLRRRSLDLLADYGVVIIHPRARAALLAAGATPGRDADRLRFPRELVEDAIAEAPRDFALAGKRRDLDLPIPRADGGFVMRTGTGAHGYVDPRDTKYRNLDLKAVREMAAVASGLDQVGFIAHPFVHGVPEVTADVHSFAEMVSHTDKHCWMQPYGKENIEFLLKIAAVAAGGETALKAHPITSVITCSFSPLEFKYMDTEVILQAGALGLPLHACSLPSAGGTAPLSTAGLVLMAAAEILSMLTVTHVLAPGTPVIAVPLMFTLDMRTGSALQSCPESIQAASMAVQLMKQGFGLPTHTYGSGSDTPDADHQSMAERALIAQAVALSGADILGGVGQLECATVFSPVQAVLDDEVGAMIRRFMQPAEISAEALNWEEMLKVRAGGHFLDSTHTLALCRDQHRPGVFLRQGRDDYEKSGRRTAFDMAREKALSLIAAAPEQGVLSEDQRREIADIVAAADRFIVDAVHHGAGTQVI